MKFKLPLLLFSLIVTLNIIAQTELEKTKVLILGTYHLNQINDFKPEMLNRLIERLDRYKFDAICIENMSGELLYDIQSRNDIAYKDIIEDFGGNRLKLADSVQSKLKISFLEAQKKSKEMLDKKHLSDSERMDLINYLIASTDLASATLQYSYLNNSTTNNVEENNFTYNQLENLRNSSNEIYSLAVRFAQSQNIQKLKYIDNLQDETLLFKYYPEFIQDFKNNQELFKDLQYKPVYMEIKNKVEQGIKAQNLYDLYLFLNSPEYQAQDFDAQWAIWFKTNFPSGSDRARYSLWEMRNLQITANILQITALYPKQNILVIIGASHKSFIEKYLEQIPDIELLELNQ